MLRYMFTPRLSLFDAVSLAFMTGSAPFIGWWALLAAFFLILASSAIEVALLERETTNDPR
jgi:hypothetical protein